jgi:hypothetical protein
VAVIGDLIVGIENRDGNANVRFHQQDTLERIFLNLEQNGIHIRRARMDCGSCSREIVETIERHSEHFYIRTNRCASLYGSLLALRGWKKEEINGIEYELNSIKIFVFKFISVPAKWIRTARHYELNIYTDNKSYQPPFALADAKNPTSRVTDSFKPQ